MCHRLRILFSTAGIWLIAISVLSAEDNSKAPDSFRVTTTVIQLQAEVTNRWGKHVANLGTRDFQITVDGKPEPVVGCTYVGLDEHPADGNTSGNRAFINKSGASQHSTVFVLNDLHMSPQDVPFVRKALREYVDLQMQRSELVAIWQVDRPNGVYQTLTSDRNVLRQAIDNLTWNSHSDRLLATFEDSTGEDERIARDAVSPDEAYRHSPQSGLDAKIASMNHTMGTDEEKSRLQAAQSGDVISALDSLVQQLRPVSGRKAIVLFADGLGAASAGVEAPLSDSPEVDRLGRRTRDLVDHASRSDAVLYTIDSRGLQYREPQGILQLWFSQSPMEVLADETGGFFSGDTNDLAGALRRIREDQQGYYLLAFKAPPGINGKLAPEKIDFHRIRVKALQSGLRVRSTAGFWSLTDDAPPDQPISNQVWNPLFSPVEAKDIHVRVTPLYGRIENKENIRIFVFADASNMDIGKNRNSQTSKAVEISLVVWGPDNKTVATFDRLIQITPKSFDGAVVRMVDVPISKSGPYQVRAVVRDLNVTNMRVGSAIAVLDVPPVHHAIAFTTPMIRPLPAGRTDFDEWIAKREFHDGQDLVISTGLQDWEPGSEPGDYEGKFRVLRDDREVISRSLPIVKSRNGKVGLITRFSLDRSFPPGEYYIEFEALQGQHVMAKARTDFVVLPNAPGPPLLQ